MILHRPGYKLGHNKFQRTEIIQRMLSHHNMVSLEDNDSKTTRTFPYVWKLRSRVLSSQWVKKEVMMEMQQSLQQF